MLNLDRFHDHLLDAINEAVIVTNLSGIIIYWNKGAEKLYKWSADEVLGKDIVSVTPSKMSKKQANEIMESLKNGQDYSGEFEVADKNGRVFYARVNNNPLKNEKGELIGIIGISNDISESSRVEQVLIESESKFRALYENSPDAIILANRKSGIIADANKAAEELFETKLDNIIGRHQSDLHPPQESQNASQSFKHKPKNNSIAPPVEIDIVTEKQNRKTVEIRGQIIEMNDEEFVLGTFRDISERKKAEKSLQEKIADLNLAQEIANIGNWTLDPTIGIPVWSDNIYSIYERDPSLGPINLDEYKVIYEADQYEIFFNAIQNAINNGTPYDIELRLKFKNDRIKWIHAICQPDEIKTKEGFLLRGTIQDITEKMQAELKLKESEKRFRLIFKRHQAVMLIIDPETGKIIDANAAAEKFYGYTCKQLCSKNIDEINTLSSDEIEILRKKAIRENKNYFEFIHKLASGESCPVEVHSSPIELEGENLLFSIVTDITKRKEAEEALRLSKENLQKTFDLSISIIAKANLNKGFFIEVNNAVTRILGYSVEEFTSTPFMDLIHPDDRHGTTEERNEQIQGKEVTSFENRYLCKDGSYKWIAWFGNKADENGIVTAVGIDVTDRKKVEEKLKEGEEKYRNLVESSPDGVVVLNKLGKVISVNKSFLDTTGYKKEDFEGKHFLKVPSLLKQDFSFYVNIFKDLLLGKKIEPIEFKWKHADGQIRVGEAKTKIFRQDGKIAGIQAVLRDVTDRVKYQKAIAESEEKYRNIVENSIQGLVIVTDNPVKINFASQPMEDILGYNPKELMNFDSEQLIGLIHPDDRERFFNTFQKRIKGESLPSRSEYKIIHKDKDLRWVELFSSIITFNGQVASQTVFIDITERKKAEIALDESQNLLQKAELISDQGSLKWDIKNDLWSFSENWLKITGFNHSGISKEELMQIVHPDDRTKVNKAFEDALNNIKPYALEHRIIRKDNGAIRFLKAMGEVQYSASGEPEFMVGIANDITEQKKTEEELENYRKNLEDLVKERTHDLEEKNKELEKYNQLFVGREFRIKELKERVKELEELLKDKI